MALADFSGADLGSQVVSYKARDVILYALAVGARATDLDLVFERDLKVLPTFALTLGLWTADAASQLGMYRPEAALHGAQSLEIRAPMPAAGSFRVSGRIGNVWDKGRSAVVEVLAESEFFAATYSIFLPGAGGWGGDPGPRSVRDDVDDPASRTTITTSAQQAALYRLTGDWHLIHIDDQAARAAGLPAPILHGLCTLGIAARELAIAVKVDPWQLTAIEARFSAPVLPGESLEFDVAAEADERTARFQMSTERGLVLRSGKASFAPPISV